MTKQIFIPEINPNDYAHLKARNRGSISEEWHKTHELNPETFAEFKALMKKADKEFNKQYYKKP
jgi:hypothetical protein